MKEVKEWTFSAPWGRVALVSWGNPSNPPVLLLHGYMDTTATFIPLINMLPEFFYYVGFDMPGHGKSEPFPPGLLISQTDIVEVIKKVTQHLKWKTFVYMAHSMGCVIGLMYNYVYPGRMRKMILLDPGPPIGMYFYINRRLKLWFNYSYNDYYDNYEKFNSGRSRLYTYDQAISLVVRNRSLTEEQAEIVLSRSLVEMGIDTYKLSWEPRMKKITSAPLSEETLYTLMTSHSTPILTIDASESKDPIEAQIFGENLMQKADETVPHFNRVKIIGGHDIHITNPELCAPHIEEFLKKDSLYENNRSNSNKCKL